MQKAIPISPGDDRELYSLVERLATQAQLPMPKVYVIPE